MRALLPVVVVALAVVACDSFSGSEVPALTDAGDVLKDAGAPATDAGLPDVATPDAADADAAPPVASCAPKHLFCDDFSDPSLGAKWSGRSDEAGPLSLASTVVGVAAPSLRVDVAPGSITRATYLERTFDAAQRMTVGVSIAFTRGDSPTGVYDGDVGLVTLELFPLPEGSSRYIVALVARPSGELVLQDQALGTHLVGSLGPAMTRVVLDLDIGAGSVRASNGPVNVQAPTAKAMSSGQRLRIGAPYASNRTGAYVVHFDDVTVE